MKSYQNVLFFETAERNRVKVGGMEMERVGEKSKRSRILLSRSRSRSPIKRKQKKKPETATGSGGKWAHDKFQETLNSPEKLEHSPAFGSHWSQIRSERSKERDRRSDSSGSRYELLNEIVCKSFGLFSSEMTFYRTA